MSKKFEIKFRLYIQTFYVRTQVLRERKFYVGCVKKTKNVRCIIRLEHQNLSSLHGTQKMYFSPKNLSTNIECPRCTCGILFQIFLTF
jgi:hypothetical protein